MTKLIKKSVNNLKSRSLSKLTLPMEPKVSPKYKRIVIYLTLQLQSLAKLRSLRENLFNRPTI